MLQLGMMSLCSSLALQAECRTLASALAKRSPMQLRPPCTAATSNVNRCNTAGHDDRGCHGVSRRKVVSITACRSLMHSTNSCIGVLSVHRRMARRPGWRRPGRPESAPAQRPRCPPSTWGCGASRTALSAGAHRVETQADCVPVPGNCPECRRASDSTLTRLDMPTSCIRQCDRQDRRREAPKLTFKYQPLRILQPQMSMSSRATRMVPASRRRSCQPSTVSRLGKWVHVQCSCPLAAHAHSGALTKRCGRAHTQGLIEDRIQIWQLQSTWSTSCYSASTGC